MNRKITITPLTAKAFAPYGDVLEARGAPDKLINAGKCGRFHDRAKVDVMEARVGISIFKADLRALPYTFDLIERHPEGSQAFIPMSDDPFLVIVSDGPETTPKAFLTDGTQAINFHRGTWHGVLTPLAGNGLFAVIDRIGETPNLEEHVFETPWVVTRG
ncbi:MULTISPECIES: ureidoglycolate lyase [Roseobacteraceae]|uniref:Ureidoglycolate hydrolase n=1 Tax=Celeribacter baekdonensis B30 TaxID=1208323 RepID=K2IL28_9RHOB|nr:MULTISPECIES: ureidoglycolate lyase [Roseobacteraceae]EKE70841.1 ureidoglycolate hydrolase [Celeribacter baekdonensis B30]KAB6716037.1 ureidoglycolate lyase [Roseobacter sp. TSBP12]|tara:strand:+ start:5251 stop:5730 length:480 start_codon:yes stop_codon:yes gene_type:complete